MLYIFFQLTETNRIKCFVARMILNNVFSIHEPRIELNISKWKTAHGLSIFSDSEKYMNYLPFNIITYYYYTVWYIANKLNKSYSNGIIIIVIREARAYITLICRAIVSNWDIFFRSGSFWQIKLNKQW